MSADMAKTNRVRDEVFLSANCSSSQFILVMTLMQVAAILQGVNLDKTFFSQKSKPQFVVMFGTGGGHRMRHLGRLLLFFTVLLCWSCSMGLTAATIRTVLCGLKAVSSLIGMAISYGPI